MSHRAVEPRKRRAGWGLPGAVRSRVLTAIVVAFLVLAGLLAVTLQLVQAERSRSSRSRVELFASALLAREREALANELFEGRLQAVDLRAGSLLEIGNILAVTVWAQDGTVVAHRDLLDEQAQPRPAEEVVDRLHGRPVQRVSLPIEAAGHRFGEVALLIDRSDLEREHLIGSLLLAISLVFGLLVMLLLLDGLISHGVLKPLARLHASMHPAGDATENPIAALPIAGADEIKDLTRSFRELVAAQEASLAQVRQAEALLSAILDAQQDAVIAVDSGGALLHANQRGQCLGATRPLANLVGLRDEHGGPIPDPLAWAIRCQQPAIARIEADTGPGRVLQVQAAVFDGGSVVVLRDITAQREVEAQLRQSQKMEAVGQLAGGVAHDFNNLLAGVMGAAELLQGLTEADHRAHRYLALVLDACERGRDLVQRLLGFSRQQRGEAKPVDVHGEIAAVISILERTIDRRVELRCEFQAQHATVSGDQSQIHGALLNLSLNARDAMPDGGLIRYRTETVDLEPADIGAPLGNLAPGRYLEVRVIDNGSGMDSATSDRVFEPFFTTKPQGKGTGLGLAAVYAMAQAHRGAVTVDSTLGVGTTFRLLLPLAAGSAPAAPETGARSQTGRDTGRVLLVDDDPMVRMVARDMLESSGYLVEEAVDGVEGVALFKQQHHQLDLVLLDMVMPRLDGAGAFARMREIQPAVPIVVVSGFVGDARIDEMTAQGLAGFLAKPFSSSSLLAMVGRLGR